MAISDERVRHHGVVQMISYTDVSIITAGYSFPDPPPTGIARDELDTIFEQNIELVTHCRNENHRPTQDARDSYRQLLKLMKVFTRRWYLTTQIPKWRTVSSTKRTFVLWQALEYCLARKVLRIVC